MTTRVEIDMHSTNKFSRKSKIKKCNLPRCFCLAFMTSWINDTNVRFAQPHISRQVFLLLPLVEIAIYLATTHVNFFLGPDVHVQM